MTEPNTITVVIVDDHAVVRQGLKMLAGAEPDIAVIGEAKDGKEGLKQVQQLRPMVVIMDLQMPGLGGVEAIRAIKLHHPDIKIITLTAFEDLNLVQETIKAGADGYVLKDANIDALLEAVRNVVDGKMPIDPTVTKKLLQTEENSSRDASVLPAPGLTDREMEVLKLICRGMTNRKIGEELNLSLGTIKTHVSQIFTKLEVSRRTEAAVKATELGLLKNCDEP